MFTGLIQTVGTISERLDRGTSTRLVVDPGPWNAHFVPGASIAVDGCCLTLVEHEKTGQLLFDVIPETLSVTTLGDLHPGRRVNLEQSVTPTTLLGGHIVQGHVDGVAEVVEVVDADEYRIFFSLPGPLMPYLTPKGSIAIAGVSMTLAEVAPQSPERAFAVALIPTTLEDTNLGDLKPGDRVNIECDVLSKTVVHWLENFRA
jgi:riboflavin synthase